MEVSPVLAPGSWGEYQCKASNRLGHASATTSITGDHHNDHDDDDPKQQIEFLKKPISKLTPGWADEASVTLSPLQSSASSHQVACVICVICVIFVIFVLFVIFAFFVPM